MSDTEQTQDNLGVMTVIEHLDELRVRLLRSIAVIVLCCGSMLFAAKYIVRFLEKPAGNIAFQALSLEEPLVVYFKVAFYSGLVLAAPYVLFEASRFVAPGLKQSERRVLIPIVVLGPLLFICGAAFAYLCVLPAMLHFFITLGQSIAPVHQRLDYYVSLVSSVMLYMGLCFQLPIVLFALSFTGLVNSRYLLKVWQYALIAISVVAAIITPDPTAFSMLMVMAALTALYFLSIGLLKLFGR